MTEMERKELVEDSRPVYMPNGVRANFSGWATPRAGISGPMPGFWGCSWETAAEVAARPDRRFKWDEIWPTGNAWLGLPLSREDFQTDEDYEVWKQNHEEDDE